MKDMRREQCRHARDRLDISASPARNISAGQAVTGSENQCASGIACPIHLWRHGDMINAGNVRIFVHMSAMALVGTDDITSGHETPFSRRRRKDHIKAALRKLGDIVFDGGT